MKAGGHALVAGECEGCKSLQAQIEEMNLAEKVMVAAGIIPAEKFDQARTIVRELHG